jgi:NADH-quinone oxidoreductase subunit J
MDAINWHGVFFLLFALAACAAAVAVVVTTNIVHMACWLVASLGAVAGLFFLAGADFLGAVQLMVYVGGTMVLLVFGVMLTARGPMVSMHTHGGQWVMVSLIGGSLLAILLQVAFSAPAWLGPKPNVSGSPVSEPSVPTAATLGQGLMGVRVDRLEQPNAVLRNGMSGYLLPFEIISVHLVVVLIGAAYLARAKSAVDPKQSRLRAAELSRILNDPS